MNAWTVGLGPVNTALFRDQPCSREGGNGVLRREARRRHRRQHLSRRQRNRVGRRVVSQIEDARVRRPAQLRGHRATLDVRGRVAPAHQHRCAASDRMHHQRVSRLRRRALGGSDPAAVRGHRERIEHRRRADGPQVVPVLADPIQPEASRAVLAGEHHRAWWSEEGLPAVPGGDPSWRRPAIDGRQPHAGAARVVRRDEHDALAIGRDVVMHHLELGQQTLALPGAEVGGRQAAGERAARRA